MVYPETEFLVLNDMFHEQQKKMNPNQRLRDTRRHYT